jgi:hypothetical protein
MYTVGHDTPPVVKSFELPERVKVLLVDDRQDKLLALIAIFDGVDLELVLAHSGKEALRLVLAHEFAVILLDVSMPIMDGFETAALIRERKLSQHIPIIFITAFRDTEMQASRGYSLGAVDYICAPVIPDVLRAKVAVFVDIFRKNRDIQRQGDNLRQEAEFRSASLEGRYDRLLDRLNVGVFSATHQGILASANPSFFRIFGLDLAVDPRVIDLADFFLMEADRAPMIECLESEGKVLEYHVRQRRCDGTIIWVSLSKTLVTDPDGQVRIDGLVEDITARKGMENALIAKAEQLARSNAELEEFAYVASHDLQEPLRTISSYASLLSGRYAHLLDTKGKEYLGHLIRGSMHMQSLIRDILSFSGIGKLPTQVPVDCNVVFGRVVFNLQDVIVDSGAEVVSGSLPTVIGDPVLLAQVFQNLIGNALKYRRKDCRPMVTVSVERCGSWWSFAVSDNGIGIESQYHGKIFSVFQRLHSLDEFAGTGIGLAICRKAIQHLGGEISVESDPGLGSVFRFTLPCGEDEGREPDVRATNSRPVPAEHPRQG